MFGREDRCHTQENFIAQRTKRSSDDLRHNFIKRTSLMHQHAQMVDKRSLAIPICCPRRLRPLRTKGKSRGPSQRHQQSRKKSTVTTKRWGAFSSDVLWAVECYIQNEVRQSVVGDLDGRTLPAIALSAQGAR